MRKLFMPTLVQLSSILTILLLGPSGAAGQTAAEPGPRCGEPELLSSHPLSQLPRSIQSTLRQAVKPGIRAIMSDPGMGMAEAIPGTVPLNAIEVARTPGPDVLYIVAWDDPSFGVNGFNWIIEITPQGAINLLSPHASSQVGGFGVEVLGTKGERYPELMIASKGYAQGGGAEAEAACFQKNGRFYESTSCSRSCQAELESK